MITTHLQTARVSDLEYVVTAPGDYTKYAVTWNPKTQGGNILVVFSGKNSSVSLTLDPGYTPVNGDMLKINVRDMNAGASSVLFNYVAYMEGYTPVTLVYRTYESGPAWVVVSAPPSSRYLSAAHSFKGLSRFTKQTPVISGSGTAICRVTFACQLEDGSHVVSKRDDNGVSYTYYGESRATVLKQISTTEARAAWKEPSSGDLYFIVNQRAGATGVASYSVDGGGYGTVTAHNNAGNTDKLACPVARSGSRVLFGTADHSQVLSYSVDYGTNWTQIAAPYAGIAYTALLIGGNYLYAGGGGGVWRTPIGTPGVWTHVENTMGMCSTLCPGLATPGSGQDSILVGGLSGAGGATFRWSVDSGTTWTDGYGGLNYARNTGNEIVAFGPVTGTQMADVYWCVDPHCASFQYATTIPFQWDARIDGDMYGFDASMGYDGLFLCGPEASADGLNTSVYDANAGQSTEFTYFARSTRGLCFGVT